MRGKKIYPWCMSLLTGAYSLWWDVMLGVNALQLLIAESLLQTLPNNSIYDCLTILNVYLVLQVRFLQ